MDAFAPEDFGPADLAPDDGVWNVTSPEDDPSIGQILLTLLPMFVTMCVVAQLYRTKGLLEKLNRQRVVLEREIEWTHRGNMLEQLLDEEMAGRSSAYEEWTTSVEGASIPALVVLVESGSADAPRASESAPEAERFAESLGATTTRILSETSGEQPTHAAILAGLRWLASFESPASVILIVSAPNGDTCVSEGFRPSDFTVSGPVKTTDIVSALSRLPGKPPVLAVYDVPSERHPWGLPCSLVPEAAPGLSVLEPDDAFPLFVPFLLRPQGSSSYEPGTMLRSIQAFSSCGSTYSGLNNLHACMKAAGETAYPAAWASVPLRRDFVRF